MPSIILFYHQLPPLPPGCLPFEGPVPGAQLTREWMKHLVSSTSAGTLSIPCTNFPRAVLVCHLQAPPLSKRNALFEAVLMLSYPGVPLQSQSPGTRRHAHVVPIMARPLPGSATLTWFLNHQGPQILLWREVLAAGLGHGSKVVPTDGRGNFCCCWDRHPY